MSGKKIVVLAREGLTTLLLGEMLERHYDEVTYVFEKAPSKWKLLRNRAKKIGWRKVLGQVLFLLFAATFIKNSARIQQILKHYKFTPNYNLKGKIIRVKSVNSNQVSELLTQLNPELVFVNGTRIISKNIIHCLPIPFINIHVGITPLYRGVHGGFWAVYFNDLENFGTTIHRIDEGIDTGSVIAQIRLKPHIHDDYDSYPILQYAYGVEKLEQLILTQPEFYKLHVSVNHLPSQLHYHPTLRQYRKFRKLQRMREDT